MLGNKRTRELHWELRKLTGQLDGGEHGRWAPAPGGGGNGGGRLGLARGGGQGAFIRGLARPWMTRGWQQRCLAVLRRSGGARTASTRPTDRRSVACARVRRHGLEAPQVGVRRGAEPRAGRASGGARPATAACWARDVVECDALPGFVLLVPCLKLQNSKFLYRSRPSDEYQSCRSSYP
jgi:hypothetical protein